MTEKEVLLRAAYAAIREMDYIARVKAFTFQGAQQLIFSAIVRSGSIEVTEQDRLAFGEQHKEQTRESESQDKSKA